MYNYINIIKYNVKMDVKQEIFIKIINMNGGKGDFLNY